MRDRMPHWLKTLQTMNQVLPYTNCVVFGKLIYLPQFSYLYNRTNIALL